ncbi:hypothetical protein [Streptomyces noursei]|uniref:hypothetical protein n=1 Tax=Streptomyces noursei TaxID=1971 RepID=UPI0030EFABB7
MTHHTSDAELAAYRTGVAYEALIREGRLVRLGSAHPESLTPPAGFPPSASTSPSRRPSAPP